MSINSFYDLLSRDATKKAQATKWGKLAEILDQCLYDSNENNGDEYREKLELGAHQFVSSVEVKDYEILSNIAFMDKHKVCNYVHTKKFLRALQHELEALAVQEIAK